MPILEKPTPQQPTLEQKQKAVEIRIKKQSVDMLQNIKQIHQQMMQIVWQNKQGLTPQQVMDAFGSDAAELFQLSNALLTMLKTVKPDDEYGNTKAPYDYTINEDGTVTIETPRI